MNQSFQVPGLHRDVPRPERAARRVRGLRGDGEQGDVAEVRRAGGRRRALPAAPAVGRRAREGRLPAPRLHLARRARLLRQRHPRRHQHPQL